MESTHSPPVETRDSASPAKTPAAVERSSDTETSPDSAHDGTSRDAPGKRRGGARAGSGPKPGRKRILDTSAFVSLTRTEKRDLERAATKAGMTVSFLIRKKLGLKNPQ